jgi:hypothetical protein
MAQANDKCSELIKQYKAGTLERVPGCDLELSLEQMMVFFLPSFSFSSFFGKDLRIHTEREKVRFGSRQVLFFGCTGSRTKRVHF